jgi:hypothetical protein
MHGPRTFSRFLPSSGTLGDVKHLPAPFTWRHVPNVVEAEKPEPRHTACIVKGL